MAFEGAFMYYGEDIVEEVRQKTDIVDLVGQYVHLKKKGSSYFGLCPFHGEKTASFSVSPENRFSTASVAERRETASAFLWNMRT